MLKHSLLLTFFTLLFTAKSLMAENVTLQITPKIKAQANYQVGEASKPVALILHGYLSTNRFHTIKVIENVLQDEGYSTLSPTLSLGINLRQNSLKCEAIHTHTLEQDLAEIKVWVDWLKQQGHQQIVLIGHSSGSQELLAYALDYPDPSIKHIILTSLFFLNGKEFGVTSEILAKAKQNAQQNRLDKYDFLFCKHNYLSTGKSFLSYQRLTRQYMLDGLEQLQTNGLAVDIIMGTADKRLQKTGRAWLLSLQQKSQTIPINNANHFFSDEHEFDLQEAIQQALKNRAQ